MTSYKTSPLIVRFLSELEDVPWFERIGMPLQHDNVSDQIHSWSEWLGPEQPSVIALHEQQQKLYDELTDKGKSVEMVAIWEQIQSAVFRVAMPKIPYDSKQDTWYAPNAALWHAAWTAGLVGLCAFAKRAVPDDIDAQWRAFVSGHWPCDWNEESKMAIVF